MRPILFRWRSLTVHSYPAMLYVGLVAGIVAGNIAAHGAGLNALRVYIATCVLIVPALVGARLLYVAQHPEIYRRNPARIWNRNEGGGAQYGGFALVLPLSIPLTAALNIPLAAFWDVSMFTILVGTVFVRIGCLLNGCCGGRCSDSWFSVKLPNHRGVWEKRIPTQALEAACAVALLILAMLLWHRMPFPGALFLLSTATYGCVRLALESLREHEPQAARFNLSHGISAALIFFSLATFAAGWLK